MIKRFVLPVLRHEFADDSNNQPDGNDKKLTLEKRLEKLQKDDNELFSAIFGKGVSKGSKEVTDQKVAQLNDEQKQRYFDSLRREKVNRALRDKAKALGFANPDDAVDFLSSKLTLNEDLEVVSTSDSEVTTIEDALNELAKRSPHLVKAKPQKPGTGSVRPPDVSTPGKSDKPTFKRSQLRDSAFYLANEKEILEAARDGRIIDDLKG